MKAIICTRFGPPEVLVLGEVPKPIPKDDEVSVKIVATVVNSGDCRMRGFDLSGVPLLQKIIGGLILGITLGVSKPRNPILGLWLAGEIEAVGKSVKRFHVGEKIYARTPDMKFGAYAEYACLPENGLIAPMPSNLSYDEAVAIPFGGCSALFFLKKGDIHKGSNVMIYGASGAVGSSAVQLAKYYGADVTGVCSTANVDMVMALGADRVIDYIEDDFASENGKYDIVFDAVGKTAYSKAKAWLKPDGKFISVITSGHAKPGVQDLKILTELVENGNVKPVIDRKYDFEQMADAHRYVDAGHKKGNVVVTVANCKCSGPEEKPSHLIN